MLEPVVNLGSSFINPKFCDVNIQLSKASFESVPATLATACATIRSVLPLPI